MGEEGGNVIGKGASWVETGLEAGIGAWQGDDRSLGEICGEERNMGRVI